VEAEMKMTKDELIEAMSVPVPQSFDENGWPSDVPKVKTFPVGQMKVYIVNYRGTIYGVFDSKEKAQSFAAIEFGENGDANILVRDVE
jgi:hypothetical protein